MSKTTKTEYMVEAFVRRSKSWRHWQTETNLRFAVSEAGRLSGEYQPVRFRVVKETTTTTVKRKVIK